MDSKIFIFIGRSGCGKGTQAKLLMEELKKHEPEREILYLQTGALIRDFIKDDSYSAHLAKEIYDAGDRQPDFLAINMWSNFFFKHFTGKENIVADGTPRSIMEAKTLDTALSWLYKIKNPIVIYLNVSNKCSVEKLLSRGRMDDNKEDIEERLLWYETDVAPAVKWYRENNYYQLLDIDGERSIDEIHKEILDKIFNS